MIIEIRPVRCFTHSMMADAVETDTQDKSGSYAPLAEAYGYFADSMVGLT